MSVKLRRGKRRIDATAELAAWNLTFTCGCDFFGQLADEWDFKTPDEVAAAAPNAWQRLGARFLAEWRPSVHRDEPWALEEFGPPDERR